MQGLTACGSCELLAASKAGVIPKRSEESCVGLSRIMTTSTAGRSLTRLNCTGFRDDTNFAMAEQ